MREASMRAEAVRELVEAADRPSSFWRAVERYSRHLERADVRTSVQLLRLCAQAMEANSGAAELALSLEKAGGAC